MGLITPFHFKMEFFLGLAACLFLWAGDGYGTTPPSYKMKMTGYMLILIISLSATIERINNTEIKTEVIENANPSIPNERNFDRSTENWI